MTKYLVTNVKIDSMSGHTIKKYVAPSNVNDIQEWLQDFNYNDIADNEAYAIWLRSVLFYNKEISFDFINIDDSTQHEKVECRDLWLADLADMQFRHKQEMTFEIDIPTMFIADITDEMYAEADNDMKQAIFEYILNHVNVNIKLLPISEQMFKLIASLMANKDALAPDNIAQDAVDLLPDVDFDDHAIEDIYNAVHDLTSAFIDEPGKYN